MRYSYTYADVLAAVEAEIGVGTNFSTAAETRLKRLIEWVNTEVCKKIRFKALQRETVIATTENYDQDNDTSTVSITNGSATVTGTDTVFTVGMVGRKIRFGTDAAYYTISSFTSTTSITLDRVYAGTTDTEADFTIFVHAYDMPRDFVVGNEKFVKYLDEVEAWSYIIWDEVEYADPAYQDFSTPICYTFVQDYRHREPATGTNTADASTSTTQIVDAALTQADDYFNDWILVNTTNNDTSKVTDFDAASDTLTCSPAITSQAVGDTYYLLDVRKRIAPYPVLDNTSGIFVVYYKAPQNYDNAYDIPDVPEEANGMKLLVAGTLADYYGKDPLALKWQGIYDKLEREARTWNNTFTNASLRKAGYMGSRSSRSVEPDVRIPYQIPT